MPCNADYMNPSHAELNSKQVAQHLVFVQEALGITPDKVYVEAAKNYYGNLKMLDSFTQDLCDMLTNLEANHPDSFEELVYCARDPQSRKLADWWEEHKAADEERRKREDAEHQKREKEYQEYLQLKEKFGD